MLSIIVAFPKIEDGMKLKSLLVQNGYEVDVVCTGGLQVVSLANEREGGIVICGYRLSDLHFTELHTYLPREFEMILVASQDKWGSCINNDIICLGIPIKVQELLNTVAMVRDTYERKCGIRRQATMSKPVRRERSKEEQCTINKAKYLLMERNNMSEDEAYRYIQKTSMDSGTNMVEMAEMIVTLL